MDGWTDEQFFAYLAGILDGEGTVLISKKSGKNGKSRYQLVVTIYQKEMDWLELLARRFGDNGYMYKLDNPSRNGNYCCQWSLYSKRALCLLRSVQPWVTLKRNQVAGAIAFQEWMNIKGVKSKSDSDFAYGQWVKDNISKFNQRDYKW